MVMQFQAPRNALLDLSPINDALDFRAREDQRAKDNQFRDEQLGMQKERFGLEKQGMEDARQKAFVQKAAGIAQMISQDTDPNRAAAQWDRLIKSDPRWGQALSQSGVDPRDFKAGSQLIIAEARGYQDPLDAQAKQAQIGLVKAQTNLANANAANKESPDQAFRVREAQARRLGLQPSDPAYRSYILTGKMPREDQQPLSASDKKAVLEAEDTVLATQNVITLLSEAEKLNSKANTGFGASARASVGNMLPDLMVPDFVSSPESSRATANYENIVLGQALQQLKSTFGAAPTEGERKILIDLQGSVSQPPEVRADILRRARVLAEKRMQDNSSRAEAIRGQTYFKPGGAATGQPQAAPRASGGDVLNEARSAIARGVPRDAVIERLRQNGIDPSGL